MKILGIIPARGGSKGVKRKNIRLVGGKPLIAHTIQAAKLSRLLTQFIISTEDDEIADIATKMEAEVIKRPDSIAGDSTPMLDVVQHAISYFESKQIFFDAVLLLQPTAPLRTSTDIDEAIRTFKNKKTESLVSVYQVSDCHPARMYRIENEFLVPLEKEAPARLRQDLPPVFHRNGAIYLLLRSLLNQGLLLSKNPTPFIMPKDRSVNIDDEIDLQFADFLLNQSEKSK